MAWNRAGEARSAAMPAASTSTPVRSSMTPMTSRSSSSSPPSRRKGRRGLAATNAPTPWRVMTSPSARSAATASRITVRLTPVAAIISCSVGNREPGGSLPLVISAVRRATSSAVRRRGASSGCSSASFFGNGLVKGLTASLKVRSSYDLMNIMRGGINQSGRGFAIRPGRNELMIKVGIASAAAGILFAAAFSSGSALAQQKLVLKASDVHPAGYPTVVAVEDIGKKLEKATNGRLSVQMYPSMQLGGEKEAIEQAQVGAIAFARVSVGALGPVVDELNVFNLPYVFRNTAHMQKVIDGPIGQDLLDKVTNSGKGLVGLAWMDAGARNFYNTKKPIKTMADLKGMKVRVMGNPMFVDMANSMGGNGVAMGYDQVFNALQTGVVDGAENNPPSFVFDNHYQVAKFYTVDEHLIVPEMVVFSKKIWDTLSKEEQELLVKFGQEAQQEERKLWEVYEKQALDKAKAAGIQIIEVSDADKKAFQDAVKPVWDKYGPKHAAMVKRIQEVK